MTVTEISKTLKHYRKSQNLTLQDLADRVGTSVAAIHRYENGWHRFELQTLNKIALALGLEIQMSLVKPKVKKPRVTAAQAHKVFKSLFWDVKIKSGDLKKHASWLIIRVLEYGQMDQVKTLFSFLGFAVVRGGFLNNRQKLSPKTQSCWEVFFQERGDHAS